MAHTHQCECGRLFRCEADVELGCGGGMHSSICDECQDARDREEETRMGKKIVRNLYAPKVRSIRGVTVSVESDEAGDSTIVFRRSSGMATSAEGGLGDLSESVVLDLTATPEECHEAISWIYLWCESGATRSARE